MQIKPDLNGMGGCGFRNGLGNGRGHACGCIEKYAETYFNRRRNVLVSAYSVKSYGSADGAGNTMYYGADNGIGKTIGSGFGSSTGCGSEDGYGEAYM